MNNRTIRLGLSFCMAAIVCLLPVAIFAQSPEVGIGLANQRIQVEIRGEAGSHYQLERSARMGSGQWQPIATLRLPGSSEMWMEAQPQDQAFYRVQELSGTPAGMSALDFRLLDHLDRSRELFYHSHMEAVVLIFGNTSCESFANHVEAVEGLRGRFESQGVIFWWIDSEEPNRSNLEMRATAEGLTIPVLHDEARLVARSYGVTKGPEACAVDTQTWRVFYRGAIDDRPEGSSGPGTRAYLEEALTAFLAGSSPVFMSSPSVGCTVQMPAGREISYETEVAPILLDSCVGCHSPGNIGPFAMTDHQAVQTRRVKIRRNILTAEMPPWHADPHYGEFANDRSLAPEDASMLVEWLDQGAPRGTGSDPLADFFENNPPPTDYPRGWPAELGTPDMILTIPRQNIPASGEVDYRYFQVNAPIPSDRWLRAAVVKPSNLSVVHHCLVFLGTLAEAINQGGGTRGFFAEYAPGFPAGAFPPDTGKFIPANPTFTLQMHYQTVGTAQTEQVELGLYFADTEPSFELVTSAATQGTILLLPGARDYQRERTVQLPANQGVWLYELSPHMHFRGSWFRFEALYPDGSSELLLSVPKYLFDWQLRYTLSSPKWMPPGTRIRCVGAYDNSAQNPKNPNPAATVRWGEQSDDEMFIGYFNYGVQRP